LFFYLRVQTGGGNLYGTPRQVFCGGKTQHGVKTEEVGGGKKSRPLKLNLIRRLPLWAKNIWWVWWVLFKNPKEGGEKNKKKAG